MVEVVTAKSVLPIAGEIIIAAMPGLFCRVDDGGADGVPAFGLLHVQFAALAMPGSVRPGIIFHGLERRQDVGIGPAAIAGIGPGVIIRLLSPYVDAAIDRAAPAEQLAARAHHRRARVLTTLQHGRERSVLGRIAETGAGTVRLDAADRGRLHAAEGPRAQHQTALRAAIAAGSRVCGRGLGPGLARPHNSSPAPVPAPAPAPVPVLALAPKTGKQK